tara:strand:- start:1045 stop:1509 length:465 start_codon:yes stop_codon:yes gene_type:complete
MANTFATPKTLDTIETARVDWNNSTETLLSNFYGAATPTSSDITIEDVATTPPSGTLFRSSSSGVLYIKDTNEKGNPLHSGFTVNGIGSRILELVGDYSSDNFEIGELFKTVGSNARIYMKSSNGGAIVDVGLPVTDSVTKDMLDSTFDLGEVP